jgi:hypothetical protein
MKRLLVLAALLTVAVSAAFAAPSSGKGKPETSGSSSSGQSPAALCKEQRQTMGAATFQSTYGSNGNGKNAFGKCVSQHAQLQSANEDNAAKQCKAERAKDPDAFAKKYGTNANLRNAFGKCVSGKSKEQSDEAEQETLNAAKQCKKERADLGADAFAAKYGTNANKRNAFGKCVSGKAKAKAKGKDEGKDDDSGD